MLALCALAEAYVLTARGHASQSRLHPVRMGTTADFKTGLTIEFDNSVWKVAPQPSPGAANTAAAAAVAPAPAAAAAAATTTATKSPASAVATSKPQQRDGLCVIRITTEQLAQQIERQSIRALFTELVRKVPPPPSPPCLRPAAPV